MVPVWIIALYIWNIHAHEFALQSNLSNRFEPRQNHRIFHHG